MRASLRASVRRCLPLNNNKNGRPSLSEYLCEYLSFSCERDEAERLGKLLADKYGSMHYIASSDMEELTMNEGLSEGDALALKLLSFVYSRSVTDSFELGVKHTEEEIEELFRALFIGLTVETVFCLFLDKKERAIAFEILCEGTVNASGVYPRRVIERALALRADSVILAHNHPKGAAIPSNEDMATTGYLSHVLSTSSISLIAHYLVSESECCKLDFKLEEEP